MSVMSRSVVVDASALLKLVLEEHGVDAAEQWFHEAWLAGDELVAPAHLHAEVGRVVQREMADLPPEKRAEAHAALLGYVDLLDARPGDAKDWECAEALEFFDALYVAAATRADGLCTCDARMAKAAAAFGVPVVDPTRGPPGTGPRPATPDTL